MAERFVIVGAGLAGALAAETLREEGFEGEVVLIGDEAHPPYERPPLSKGYLRGEEDREAASVHPAAAGSPTSDLRTGTRVASVDVAGRWVRTSTGETIGYDRLLLATGAEPRRLPVPGADLPGVHHLRTFEDSDRLRSAIRSAGRVAVIGAGWIGSEVAASARQMGREVSIVERAEVPLQHVLGREVGRIFLDLHADHGVDLYMGEGVREIVGTGHVEGVRTESGRLVPADVVVAGVGVVPRTTLAEQAGLAVDDGIAVDEHLETSATGVFAAGDVASAHHPFYRRRVRVEHWSNARHQGAAAARNMLGRGEAYDRIPYFFSDQYDLGMEYTGLADTWDRVVFRGDPAGREVVVFWLREGRVLAGMNVNVWDVAGSIEALVRSPAPVDPDRLADPGLPLEDLVPAA